MAQRRPQRARADVKTTVPADTEGADPRLFRALRQSGQLDAHLEEKSTSAHDLLDLILSNHPHPSLAARRGAEEQGFATLISFPPEGRVWAQECAQTCGITLSGRSRQLCA